LLRDGDARLELSVSPKGYLKLMGDAYLVWRCGEMQKPGYFDLN
jgi:hypothetical protein